MRTLSDPSKRCRGDAFELQANPGDGLPGTWRLRWGVSAPLTPYDEVRYASGTFPQTHPDRLATLATGSGCSRRRSASILRRPAWPRGESGGEATRWRFDRRSTWLASRRGT